MEEHQRRLTPDYSFAEKNFARKIDSKLKKSTILGIVATYSGNVVPNAVSVENESKNGVVQWYNGTFAFSMYHNPTQLTVERAKSRLIFILILYLYIIIYYNI